MPAARRRRRRGRRDQDGAARPGLNSPFGMALVGGELFVANADALVAFPSSPARRQIDARPRLVTELPSGYNHHWTKSLVAIARRQLPLVGVGSNSNAGENGLEMEKGRAAIWKIDPRTGRLPHLRQRPAQPGRDRLQPGERGSVGVVNERDELGSDLVPDYLTSVQRRRLLRLAVELLRQACRRPAEAAAAGHGRQGDRPRLRARPACRPARPDLRQPARSSARASPGRLRRRAWLVEPQAAPAATRSSSCRSPGRRPIGASRSTSSTGFRVGDNAYGRPVGVQIASDGSLLVADDVGGKVWRVSAATLPRDGRQPLATRAMLAVARARPRRRCPPSRSSRSGCGR